MRKVFSFTGARKIIFGNGSIHSLASQIKELGAKNPLVVMDKNLAKVGLSGKNCQSAVAGRHKIYCFQQG